MHEAFCLRLVRLQFALCAPIVLLNDATFLQITRLLQVTSTQLNAAEKPGMEGATTSTSSSAAGERWLHMFQTALQSTRTAWRAARLATCGRNYGRCTNLCTIWSNIAPKLRGKTRHTGGAQNWPQRFAPRPILGGGGVAVFRAIYGVISASFSTKSCKDLSIHSNSLLLSIRYISC